MTYTHECAVYYGHGGPLAGRMRTEVFRFVVREARYEDERGYSYDRHLCPGVAIVSQGRGGAGYTRRMLLETLRPLAARPRNGLARPRNRL